MSIKEEEMKDELSSRINNNQAKKKKEKREYNRKSDVIDNFKQIVRENNIILLNQRKLEHEEITTQLHRNSQINDNLYKLFLEAMKKFELNGKKLEDVLSNKNNADTIKNKSKIETTETLDKYLQNKRKNNVKIDKYYDHKSDSNSIKNEDSEIDDELIEMARILKKKLSKK